MRLSRSRKNSLALAASCLASLMFGLEISSVPVILPALEKVLHGDFQDLQWIMNAYTLACTTVLMATGALADRYGRKRLFIGSIVAFGLASLLCGLAANTAALIAGRALQGVAGGAMLICLLAILSHQFRQGPERTRAFATWGMVSGIGLGFGPIVGGMIVALSDWSWVFLIHLPLAALTLALVLAGVDESRDPQAARLDVAGIATLSLAVFGLSYSITQGPALGGDVLRIVGAALALLGGQLDLAPALAPAIAALAAGGVVLATALSLVAFVVIEKRQPHPMMDFAVFRNRRFSGALCGSLGMNFSYWPFMIYLPIYFQSVLGYGSVRAGLALLAYTVPTLLLPPLAERLARGERAGLVIPAGLFTIGSGFMLMYLGAGAGPLAWLGVLPGAALAGIGLGLTHTPVSNTATAAVAANRAGMASGIDTSARLIALAINIALMGSILLAGISAYLQARLPGAPDAGRVRALAERIAAGDVAAAAQSLAPADAAALAAQAAEIAHGALLQGFEWVMLYGGAGAWLLAGLSWLTFAPRAGTAAAGVAAPPA
ncbi:MFS transporter [Rugamonas sp. CCM 8940]|uniref:MFS transporter n=1 Tax=Rugamonas sp. CCM 8940 TaxID=2765359 RepID=UPI0018F6B03A|nr:MFS transporter [Rugamonas sp. CCM 8940]MBJ7313970.1 MFS transporter [Rugamonas sp. CCM 8940]